MCAPVPSCVNPMCANVSHEDPVMVDLIQETLSVNIEVVVVVRRPKGGEAQSHGRGDVWFEGG